MKKLSLLQTFIISRYKRRMIIIAITVVTIGLFSSYTRNNTTRTGDQDDLRPITIGVKKIADQLHSPTDMASPGNNILWITEQTGYVRIIRNGKLETEPLLDVTGKMRKINGGYEERGLLGITLHPQFKANGKFYVFYTGPSKEKSNHKEVVAEYKYSFETGRVDTASNREIITIEHPEGNHNGGCIKFGPDGYLYVASGDGGGQGDKHGEFGNGQKMDTRLGKILRIDVNTASGFGVPKDNPFVGRNDAYPEIWAYGFRNPYRFSFDRVSGELFAGDVGQDLWEEIDIVKKGANYGWKIAEGNHCYTPNTGCDLKGITMPINDYSHKVGVSVIGGFVYQGLQIPLLKKDYVFADWTGPLFYLKKVQNKWLRGRIKFTNIPDNLKILGFGEDQSGELYILTNTDTGPENTTGGLYQLTKATLK